MSEPLPSYRDRFGYLPAVATMLVETVGEDTMLRIVADLGGTRISVGKRSLAKSPLTRIVGETAARLIFERAGRDHLPRLDIPRMGHALTRLRHDRVLRLRAEGTKIEDIARIVSMTERNVHYILAADKAEPDPRQLTIFDLLA